MHLINTSPAYIHSKDHSLIRILPRRSGVVLVYSILHFVEMSSGIIHCPGSVPFRFASAYCLFFLSNVSLHGCAFCCGWILLFCIQLGNRLSMDFYRSLNWTHYTTNNNNNIMLKSHLIALQPMTIFSILFTGIAFALFGSR